ncbi:MAG: hypothetical protein R3C14_47560 [Caldilineaceae bacterium]
MNHLPFDKPGRFWKGNLHTHCTQSDGRLTTEQVCQKYREAGYDFLAVTNHFLRNYNFPMTDTRHLRTDDFTTLIGAELHTPVAEMGEVWHILAVGLPLDFAPPTPAESGPQIAARALATGAYVAIAHPHRCVMTEAEFSLASFASPYCRVTVRTDDGKRAWSNPIALDPTWFDR